MSATRQDGEHDDGLKLPSVPEIVAGAIAVVGTVVPVVTTVGFVVVFGDGVGTCAILLGLCAIVEGFAWASNGRFGEAGRGRLARSLVGRAILLSALAVAGFLGPNGALSVLAVGAACLGLGVSRIVLHQLRRLERRHASFATRRRARWDGRESAGLRSAGAHAPAEDSKLEALAAKATAALLVLLAGLVLATGVEAAALGRWSTRHGPKVTTIQPYRRHRKAGKATPGVKEPGAGSPDKADPQKVEHHEEPPSETCSPITDSAIRESAVEQIEHLMSLAGAGSAVACPSTIKVQPSKEGPIYWSVAGGRLGSDTSAVAVIAPQERRFVALTPAAETVEEEVEEGRAIGAEREFARYYAGHGSFYVLLSAAGSTLLSEESLEEPQNVVVSPPAVATAIRSTDKQFKKWFWPSEPESHGTEETFALKLTLHGRVFETIHYDTVTHTAWRGSPSDPIPYTATQANLVVGELKLWAPEASPAEKALEEEIERDEG